MLLLCQPLVTEQNSVTFCDMLGGEPAKFANARQKFDGTFLPIKIGELKTVYLETVLNSTKLGNGHIPKTRPKFLSTLLKRTL